MGAATPSDLIWREGLGQWTPIDQVEEFANTPPPIPAPPHPPQPPPLPTTTGEVPPNAQADEQQLQQAAIVLGATLGILSHELGHALIGEFQIPATGSEEDTADEFSAMIMTSMTSQGALSALSQEQRDFLARLVSYSSLLWYYDAQKQAQTGQTVAWYDEHSPSEVRFRNTLCMLYGSDPALYRALADKAGLPERERGRCEVDFTKRNRAWEVIVAPYARNVGGEYPGHLPSDAPGAKVTVSYAPSQTAIGQGLKTAFEQIGIFTGLGEELERLLAWKRDFTIAFADCGIPNAFYDPNEAKITMCWEGVEYFYWIIAEAEGFQRGPAQNLSGAVPLVH